MNDRESLARAEELFRRAAPMGPEDRAAFLDDHCADDAELRREVESLLQCDAQNDGFLDGQSHQKMIAHAIGSTPVGEGEEEERLPRSLGRYTLLRLIGRGGMGVVYEAEQEAPHRRVALKLVLSGTGRRQLARRLAREAEALGRLQHPAIARIYDAGEIEDGEIRTPFFAMELVAGEPITRHVRSHSVSRRGIIDLLVGVARGVQHAHERGVIHRDLKPANILVDGAGQPRILDFGIARITDADVRATTLQTSVGQIVGTVAYMSPEQASGDPGAIDERSDVYSLGVVAYELLTGRLPVPVDNMLIHEAVRAIREDEPTAMTTITRGIPTDLRTIVGKALEKDKSRRYASAGAFAGDLERFLNDQPIQARRPSAAYQLSKFARRNKGLVAGIGAVMIALAAGTIVSSTLAIRARAARDEAVRQAAIARAVNDFLNNDLLAQADPYESGGEALTVRQALDKAAATIGGRFEDRPGVEAELRHTIGNAYRNLGEYEPAELHLKRAIELSERLYGPDHWLVLSARQQLAGVYDDAGRADEAEPILRDVVERWMRVKGPEASETLSAQSDLAVALTSLARFDEASGILEEVLPISTRVLGPGHERTMKLKMDLAGLRYREQDYAGAAALMEEAIAHYERVLGPDHPETITIVGNLALMRERLGQYDTAEKLYGRCIAVTVKTLGAEHPHTLTTRSNIGLLYARQGRNDEAEAVFREVLAIRLRTLDPGNTDIPVSRFMLGRVLLDTGRYAEAEPELFQADRDFRAHLGAEHPYTERSEAALINLYQKWEKPELAAQWERVRDEGVEPPDTLTAHSHAPAPDAASTSGQ